MTDPFEEKLDELIEAARDLGSEQTLSLEWGENKSMLVMRAKKEVDELKRRILNSAYWIGDDDDCACLPDSEPCTYCSNRYQLERERTKE